jgi:hypothetical protein
VKFTAVRALLNGVELDKDSLGAEYSIIFHENMTADIVFAGLPYKGLMYTCNREGDLIQLSLEGLTYDIRFDGECYIMDFGSNMQITLAREE